MSKSFHNQSISLTCNALRQDVLLLTHHDYPQSGPQLSVGYLLLIWLVKLQTASCVILPPLQKVEGKSSISFALKSKGTNLFVFKDQIIGR